ncbi:unnamed protein product [Orchesella dallaii]|uniref:C2H2-type domain-containing protein n=1 Tax=Orchesella dallaii TaxID=48710 RepID=A0ABP1RG36_9HEXA
MNILEHDSDGKFYHEYSSSITRGGSTEVVNSSTSVLTGFNGLESQQYPKESSERLIENSSSSGIKGSTTNCRDSRLIGEMDGGANRVLNSIVIKEEPEDDSSFSCEKCGKAAYRNGEFETIKLGDIFTHITQFPSSSEATHYEGPRLCAQCLNSSHVVGSTAHLHLHHNKSSVINSSVSSNNNNTSSSSTSNTVVVTSTNIVTSSGSPSNTSSSGTSNNISGGKNGTLDHGEGSGQLLQGVSTIIMQNSNHPSHHQQHHHPQQPHIHLQSQYQQQQGQQTSQSHSHNLQSPPPPPPQEMHHDHQQQHFYQQGHILQPEMRGVKLEPDSIVHSQQQHQHLDNFMLIHDGAMYTNNNDSLQQQTMVSFHHHQSDNHLHHQRQVICDNQPQAQQQQQHHQPAIQHITVVTPGSDIKYNIPTAVMQMQGKEQAGIDQGQGQQLIQFSGQNPLIPLPQHSDPTSGGVASGVNDNSGVGAPPTNFQYIAVTTSMDSSNSSIDLKPSFTTSASVIGTNTPTVVTHTVSSSSSIMTPATVKTSKASAKSRSKTNSTASGSGAGKNAQQGESPKIPCDLCKKKFKSPKMAMNHYKRVHQKEARFICDICGAVFSYRGSLDSHLVSHKPPEKTHDCEKCGMKFNVKANLRQHMRIHSDNPKKFPCDFCPSGFSKRVNLRYHIKRKHPEEAEKMNNNNNSKDSSGAGIPPSGLAEALAGTIIPSNPAIPGVGDNSKDNKNQGNFKCEHCDRAFLFKNNLKAHLRTHTRDKKYTCDLCGKSFIYKESLKNHMLLHSNELPYLCDICGKKFRDRSNRRKHVKNVHKYLFINGDINNPVKPGTVAPGSSSGVSAGIQGPVSVPQPGEPPTKKRKVSKKAAAAAAAAAALQQNPVEQLSQDNSSKTRSIIKSPGAPRGKKAKNASTIAATKTASNTKSVIVSASTTGSLDTKVDRKIIVSPSPKNSGASVGSPSSLEYVHSHSSLPVTVHVPLSGSQGQFSHGRNIIVKAASSTTAIPPNHQSPPALSPEMYHHSHQHGRGPASMQQNVIVYPKPKVIPDHSQQYPSSSVISQTMQQPAQHQYYVNADQQHHHQHQQGYSYLQLASQPSPVQSSLMPQSHISSPNPSAFEYVLGSTNLSSSQDSRGSDPSGAAHPYGSGGPGNPSHPPMEIQVVNAEYSHLYPTDPNSLPYEQHHHYHWTSAPPSAPPGMDHGAHPPNSSSPYELVAPPAGSNGSSSGLVNEGPASHQHPPVSIAQSYDSGGINQGSNALSASSAVYSTGAAQGHEVLDPSGNGGFFYKDDFDFSYL